MDKELYKLHAEICKTLSNPIRLEILNLLRDKELSVSECYRDLAKEIVAGQDKYQRPVIDGKAIQKELNQIGDYLSGFKI